MKLEYRGMKLEGTQTELLDFIKQYEAWARPQPNYWQQMQQYPPGVGTYDSTRGTGAMVAGSLPFTTSKAAQPEERVRTPMD